MTVEEHVTAILVEQLGVEEKEVTPDASLIDDLGADSLDLVEVIMALEEEFDLDIPDEDSEGIATFADVVAYVKNKTATTQES
ncbi:MAG: acyl carrier protein [bacterium]|nr:acyl carrier protein [bacterium]MDZ4285757.1 acyl carrier protein [Candidatus Sungbacteria bacterium]